MGEVRDSFDHRGNVIYLASFYDPSARREFASNRLSDFTRGI